MRDRTLLILLGISAGAAALRFATLDAQSWWNDEAVTALLLDQGLGGMLADVPDSESTPPLYYVLAWLWSQLFGTGEVGLRSLSALAGTATVPAAYAAGAAFVSRRAGLVAAALVAANPLLVWYSQEARAYALLVVLAALSLWLLAGALRGEGRALAWWAVMAALALATHYFALFVVVPEAALLIARRRPRRPALLAAAAPAAAGLALLPLALHQRSNEGAAFIGDSSLAFRLAQVPKQFLAGFSAPAEPLLVAIAAACAGVGAVLLVRARDERVRVPAIVACAALLLPIALALVTVDYVITRNLIAALVPLAVVLGAGFERARTGFAAAAVLCAVGVAISIAVASDGELQRDDWRSAARALGPPTANRAIVVTPVEGGTPLRVYLPRAREVATGEPIVVTEIDYLGLPEHRPGTSPKPPGDPLPGAPGLPGFRLAERVERPAYTLLRYRATEPHGVFAEAIATYRLDREASQLVLYEPAG